MKEKVSGFWMEGERWIPTFVGMTFREMGMTEGSDEIAALSSKVMTEGWIPAFAGMTNRLNV